MISVPFMDAACFFDHYFFFTFYGWDMLGFFLPFLLQNGANFLSIIAYQMLYWVNGILHPFGIELHLILISIELFGSICWVQLVGLNLEQIGWLAF